MDNFTNAMHVFDDVVAHFTFFERVQYHFWNIMCGIETLNMLVKSGFLHMPDRGGGGG